MSLLGRIQLTENSFRLILELTSVSLGESNGLDKWAIGTVCYRYYDVIVRLCRFSDMSAAFCTFVKRQNQVTVRLQHSLSHTVASFFSPLGKLAGRAIYFTCVNFFLFFKLSKALSGSTGPIFTIFSPNGRYLCEC